MTRLGRRSGFLAAGVLLTVVATVASGCGGGDSGDTTRDGAGPGAPSSSATPQPSSPPGGTTATVAGPTAGASATAAPAGAPPAFDDATDPLRMLVSYYNAVNRADLRRAYAYLRSPSATFDDFAKGYADTKAVVASLAPASGIDAGAGQRRMLISAVLDVQAKDGTATRFSGCYVAWRAAEGVSSNPADNHWRIEEGAVAEAPGQPAPLAVLLPGGCAGYRDRVSAYGAAYDDRTGGVNVVSSLYDAINRSEYERGLGYWEQPPQTLDAFRAGYAGTASSVVTFGTPVRGGAAGSVYESVPAVITATGKDGSVQRFSGCYVARRSNIAANNGDPAANPWSIYGADLRAAGPGDEAGALLASACPD